MFHHKLWLKEYTKKKVASLKCYYENEKIILIFPQKQLPNTAFSLFALLLSEFLFVFTEEAKCWKWSLHWPFVPPSAGEGGANKSPW